MATKTIAWTTGDGNITLTYNGQGNDTVSVSSNINEGIDREQTINLSTTKGNNPKSVDIVVKQEGMREVFVASDGSFLLANGGTLNTLKNELQ